MATILIVEHDRHLAQLTALIMSRAGHSAVAVPDAVTALSALDSLTFDLLLVDLQLRGPLDGSELIKVVRRKLGRSAMRFIVMSDDTQASALERVRLGGAAAVLLKPFKPVDVTRVLDSVLLISA